MASPTPQPEDQEEPVLVELTGPSLEKARAIMSRDSRTLEWVVNRAVHVYWQGRDL